MRFGDPSGRFCVGVVGDYTFGTTCQHDAVLGDWNTTLPARFGHGVVTGGIEGGHALGEMILTADGWATTGRGVLALGYAPWQSWDVLRDVYGTDLALAYLGGTSLLLHPLCTLGTLSAEDWGDIFSQGANGFVGVSAIYRTGVARTAAAAAEAEAAAAGETSAGLADDAARSGTNTRIPCANSFAADTLVATPNGEKPIASIAVGDLVLAYNPDTGTTGSYTVTAVLIHTDPTLIDLAIDGEQIETTPEHPFFVDGRGWVNAGDLQRGDHVRKANGGDGVVQANAVVQRTQVMYNLTVAVAHTFFVGDGRWLVHNSECNPSNGYPRDFPTGRTRNWSAYFGNEGEARALAREKVGIDPVQVEPYKWRSRDGKWQYRAKPGDIIDRHIHLEELDPATGEVLQNAHLRWPLGTHR